MRDRKVDPDSVAPDPPVALREMQELALHSFDVPCVGEVAERVPLLGKGDLEQLDERLARGGYLAQLVPRRRGDPDQARLPQAEHELVLGRGKQHAPWPAFAGDDGTRAPVRRAANDDEPFLDGEKHGVEKRLREVRLAWVELERRTADEDLGGAVGVGMRVVEQERRPAPGECACLHPSSVSRRYALLTRRRLFLLLP